MRINERFASIGVSNRHRYVAHAAIHCGIEFALKLARNKLEEIDGYSVPEHAWKISQDKLAAIISGQRHCAAYMANACLDAIVAAGYYPASVEERTLYCVTILTRSNVKDLSTALAHIPETWPEDLKLILEIELANLIDGVSDGLFYKKCG